MRSFRVDYTSAEGYDHGEFKSHIFSSEKEAHKRGAFVSHGYAEGEVKVHTLHNGGIVKTTIYDEGRPQRTLKY